MVALAADPLRPARGAERLGEPAAHHRVRRALAALDRRHQRQAAGGRLGLGEIAQRLARGRESPRRPAPARPRAAGSPTWSGVGGDQRREALAPRRRGSRPARSRRRRRRGRDAGWPPRPRSASWSPCASRRCSACTRAASAAAGISVGASRFACSAASLPRRGVAGGERRAGVGERQHRVAPGADVARQQPGVDRGVQRLARARPSPPCCDCRSKSVRSTRSLSRAQREGLLGQRHARCRCRPPRASAASAPARRRSRVRSFGSIAL